jgi:hypothetical protein
MRITACIVVAVLGSSLEALAQPPAHAKGKAHAYGHASGGRSQFAIDDFKIGLGNAQSPKVERKSSAEVQVESPRPAPSGPVSRSPLPDCISR